MSLLPHVTTPIYREYSPSKLLMGRKLRSNIPIHPRVLKWPNFIRNGDEYKKAQQQHRTRKSRPLEFGTRVWVRSPNTPSH